MTWAVLEESVCQKWGMSKAGEKPCEESCFVPRKGRCPDIKIVDAVPRDASVKKNFMETPPESPPQPPSEPPYPEIKVRRLMGVNIKDECGKTGTFFSINRDVKDCSLNAAQNADISPNLCSAACRPLSTMLHLNEWTKRPLPKPTYQNAVGFRLRRLKNKFGHYDRDLFFRDSLTDNWNLVLLSNCCDDIHPLHFELLKNT